MCQRRLRVVVYGLFDKKMTPDPINPLHQLIGGHVLYPNATETCSH